MYIIITNGAANTFWAALISATFSMISISWGMASYARALRKASPETTGQMTRKAVFFYFLWVVIYKNNKALFSFYSDSSSSPLVFWLLCSSHTLTSCLFWFQSARTGYSWSDGRSTSVRISTIHKALVLKVFKKFYQRLTTENSGFFQMVMAFLQVFLFFHLCEGPSRENMCKV